MSVPSTAIWENETGGSDTANGGGFDPGNVSMATDGAATSANTSSPVFTSASYSFTASDVGAWLFIQAGTNWIPGWYKIASVAAGAATLTATAGAAVLYGTTPMLALSTAAGCATTASPTAATWSVDYSQQASPRTTLTAATAAGAGSTLTDPSIGKNWVGNSLHVTGGTNVTTGIYFVSSTSTTTATLDRAVTTGATSTAAGGMGGALASPGFTASLKVAGNATFCKAGTYLITAATTNVAGGCVNDTAGGTTIGNTTRGWWIGYSATRGDAPGLGSRPEWKLNTGVSSATIAQNNAALCSWAYIRFNGNSQTSAIGLNTGNHVQAYAFYCDALNCPSAGLQVNRSDNVSISCYATGCGKGLYINGLASRHVSTGNTIGIYSDNNLALDKSISYANSGDGVSLNNTILKIENVTSYGNGGDGFDLAGGADRTLYMANCIAAANSGFGWTNDLRDGAILENCASWNNTSGNSFGENTNLRFVSLSGNPFTNAAGGDFSLNNTAGAGAACRAAGIPGAFPGGTTTGFLDIGAAQHQDSGGGGTTLIVVDDD